LAVHETVYANRQDDWRNNSFKVKRVRNAIKAALKDDESATERVLELVKNQNEY
jgi:type I restriction enzyme R subunit